MFYENFRVGVVLGDALGQSLVVHSQQSPFLSVGTPNTLVPLFLAL